MYNMVIKAIINGVIEVIKFTIDSILEQRHKESKDFSLYWLAKESKISYPTIHKIVNNKTSSVNLNTLEQICKALEVNIQDILKITKDNDNEKAED